MTLTNYWWLLIWLALAGGLLSVAVPKKPTQVLGKTEYRWMLDGKLPENENEIAVDRLFAKNNKLKIGDNLTINKKKLSITGIIALPNYSTLYESNTDSMFDSLNFTVAVMTESGFDAVKCQL